MNLLNELYILKDEVMQTTEAEGKIKARNHIERLIKYEEEKENFPIPEWLTIQAKNIGADE